MEKDKKEYRFEEFIKLIIENKNSKLVYLMTYYFEVINGIINFNEVPEGFVNQLAFINKSINALLNGDFIIEDNFLQKFKNLCDSRFNEKNKIKYTEENFKNDLQFLYDELLKMYEDGIINEKEDISKNLNKIIVEGNYGY